MKDNKFNIMCEGCDEEFHVLTTTTGLTPAHCPFCGSEEITLMDIVESEFVSGVDDEDEIIIEDEDS